MRVFKIYPLVVYVSRTGNRRSDWDRHVLPPMGIFTRCQITLELDSTANFKFKTALKKKIVDNDGIVSFIVTKKVKLIYDIYSKYSHTTVVVFSFL